MIYPVIAPKHIVRGGLIVLCLLAVGVSWYIVTLRDARDRMAHDLADAQMYIMAAQGDMISTTSAQKLVDTQIALVKDFPTHYDIRAYAQAHAQLQKVSPTLEKEYAQTYTDTQTKLVSSQEKLAKLMIEYTGSDIPELVDVQGYTATISAQIIQVAKAPLPAESAARTRTLQETRVLLTDVELHMHTLATAIHEYRLAKAQASLQTVVDDAAAYIDYLSRRTGHEALISQLTTIKERATSLATLTPDDDGIDMINTELTTDMYPTLQQADATKQEIAEKELAEYQKKLAELAAAQTVVPEAPVKDGKVIFVSIGAQRLYAYEDGTPVFSYPVPVTTGKNGYQTVTGEFAIYQKSTNFTMRSPFPNDPYTLYVKYWMPFYGGFGLHDAPWRSVFGGQEYPWSGTHGCVNMRESEVSKLFEWAPIGTKVIVQ